MELTKEAPQTLAQTEARPADRFVPAVNISETAEEYVVTAEMPGCDPQGIDVQFENGALAITGRVSPRPAPRGAWLVREYGIGDYHRAFNVTDSIDAEKISADYEHGVLTLRLPKVAQAKPRRIEVRTK